MSEIEMLSSGGQTEQPICIHLSFTAGDTISPQWGTDLEYNQTYLH